VILIGASSESLRDCYEIAWATIARAIAAPDGAYVPPLTAAARPSSFCARWPESRLMTAAGAEMETLSLDAELPGSRVSPAETEPAIELDGRVFAKGGVVKLPGSSLSPAARLAVETLSLD
jgi:hypothetical protein